MSMHRPGLLEENKQNPKKTKHSNLDKNNAVGGE